MGSGDAIGQGSVGGVRASSGNRQCRQGGEPASGKREWVVNGDRVGTGITDELWGQALGTGIGTPLLGK